MPLAALVGVAASACTEETVEGTEAVMEDQQAVMRQRLEGLEARWSRMQRVEEAEPELAPDAKASAEDIEEALEALDDALAELTARAQGDETQRVQALLRETERKLERLEERLETAQPSGPNDEGRP